MFADQISTKSLLPCQILLLKSRETTSVQNTVTQCLKIYRLKNLPKLLYTCVRRKAYPSVLENGIRPMGFSHVILSSEPEMAKRIGRRRDPLPVRLVVQTEISLEEGITFYEAGETLYLAESIQPGCFTGPPLPKQKEPVTKRDAVEEPALERMPGSFMLELKEKNCSR